MYTNVYVSPKNILLQLRVNLNHPWTRTVGAGRPQAAVLEAPPTSTRSRTTISVLFVVCSPPVCLNKRKKCLLAERPEACLVRGRGCPQHNPQPARLDRRLHVVFSHEEGSRGSAAMKAASLETPCPFIVQSVETGLRSRSLRAGIPSETLVKIRRDRALRALPLRQRFKAWGGRDSSRWLDGSSPAL